MIVLDTHAWVWWVSSPSLLSARARGVVDGAVERHELFVSAISAWEVAMLVGKGRLELTMDARAWIARCESLPLLSFVPVSVAIAVEAVGLPGFPYADPADRIIVATAMIMGAKLVTKDFRLLQYRRIETVW